MTSLPLLFSPLELKSIEIKNRIFITGHRTNMAVNSLPTERMVAYHAERAKGGVGLIVTEVAHVHESAVIDPGGLAITSDDAIPHFKRMIDAVNRHDCRIFGQLYHPGRAGGRSMDGSIPVRMAPSAIPDERNHVMPREMPIDLIEEIENAFARSACRMVEAGYDGIELYAAHGVLPTQFLSPATNRRTDRYGGSFENRIRFLRNVIAKTRTAVGKDYPLGLRMSHDEFTRQGMNSEDAEAAFRALDEDDLLDYFNVTVGSIAAIGPSRHIVPPMWYDAGYVAPHAGSVRSIVSKPVFFSGRVNQPQEAEKALVEGQCDMVAMTRANICDPHIAGKARTNRLDDIRACIGCNQACIGHMHLGFSISCIQYPESGRELEYGKYKKAKPVKSVWVIGGGPGGMKAAAVAASRGHSVTLFNSEKHLGGQARLAQLLPGRSEFGGIITNLTREMELAGVNLRTGKTVTASMVHDGRPDAVIVATGALPYRPEIEGAEEAHLVEGWDVIRDTVNVGQRVVVADWRGDWISMGVSEKLAKAGCDVTLVVNGPMVGGALQSYVRDHWVGLLHEAGVKTVTYAGLYGVDDTTVYFEHLTSDQPVVIYDVDTVVTCLGHVQNDALLRDLQSIEGMEVHAIGDCVAPRTAEEAVLEGMKIAARI